MRLIVASGISEIEGEETIHTVDNATIESIILGFCVERRLPSSLLKNFALQTANGKKLVKAKTIAESNISDGSSLILVRESITPNVSCSTWCFFALLAGVVAIVGIITVCVVYARSGSFPFDYAIVIDAGSSHSKLFVYKWKGDKALGTGVARQEASKKCDDNGISHYADNPQLAGSALDDCLLYASKVIPSDKWSETPIFVGATAGMRILNHTRRNASDSILGAIRKTIRANYTFKLPPNSVRIISGHEEAFFSWISINYIMNRFSISYPSSDPSQTYKFYNRSDVNASYGILDMGGASSQISFAVQQVNQSHESEYLANRLFGVNYTSYTHSFLCYGKNEAQKRFKAFLIQEYDRPQSDSDISNVIIRNPCAPLGNETVIGYDWLFGKNNNFCTAGLTPNSSKGFDSSTNFTFVGTSEPDKCKGLIVGMLTPNTSECEYGEGRCSFDGVYQPANSGRNFTAFSSYYYIMSFFNATSNSSTGRVEPERFRNKLDNYCSLNYSKVKQYETDETRAYLTEYCFDGHYLLYTLEHAFLFNTESSWNRLHFIRNYKDQEFGWTLGFALLESNALPAEEASHAMGVFVFLVLLLLFVGLLGVSAFFTFFALKNRKKYENYEPMDTYGIIA